MVRPIIEVAEVEEAQAEIAPLYDIFIHNDNVTPMDFVVHILKSIFKLKETQAAKIMLVAHTKGKALVQTLPKTEAEKRINLAHFASGMVGFPLHFTMELE